MRKYKLSNELVFGLGKAIITLTNQTILITRDGQTLEEVTSPKVLVDLFTVDELKRYYGMSENDLGTFLEVQDAVVRDKVVEVIGWDGYYIPVGLNPAGVISFIAQAILLKSYSYLNNPEQEYTILESTVTMIDQMAAIIANFLHIPYTYVMDMPINEIFRLHNVARLTFPDKITDFREKDLIGEV